jgi:hypothetical protein
MEQVKKKNVRRISAAQARALESVRVDKSRRASDAGATFGEGPDRAHVGRGARISK